MEFIVYVDGVVGFSFMHRVDSGCWLTTMPAGTRSRNAKIYWSEKFDDFFKARDFIFATGTEARICSCVQLKQCPKCGDVLWGVNVDPPAMDTEWQCRKCHHYTEHPDSG